MLEQDNLRQAAKPCGKIKFRRSKLCQRDLNAPLPENAPIRAQGIREFASDRCGDLRHFLDRTTADPAAPSANPQGGGDRKCRERTGSSSQPPSVSRSNAELEHRLGQLLDQERHAVGLGDDLFHDVGRKRLAPRSKATMALAMPAPQPIRETARSGCGVSGPARFEFRAAGHYEQGARFSKSQNDPPDKIESSRIGPVHFPR